MYTKTRHWLGHVERMNNDKLPVLALHTRTDWTKSRGWQSKRWVDILKEDVGLQEKDSNIQEAGTLWKDHQKRNIFIQHSSTIVSSQMVNDRCER